MMDLFQDDVPNLDGTAVICGISAPDHRLSLFFDATAVSVLGDRIDLHVNTYRRVLVVSRGMSLRMERIDTRSVKDDEWMACRRIKVQLAHLPINVPLPFRMAQVQAIIRNGKVRMNIPSMVEV